jgi:hypothetical protein
VSELRRPTTRARGSDEHGSFPGHPSPAALHDPVATRRLLPGTRLWYARGRADGLREARCLAVLSPAARGHSMELFTGSRASALGRPHLTGSNTLAGR